MLIVHEASKDRFTTVHDLVTTKIAESTSLPSPGSAFPAQLRRFALPAQHERGGRARAVLGHALERARALGDSPRRAALALAEAVAKAESKETATIKSDLLHARTLLSDAEVDFFTDYDMLISRYSSTFPGSDGFLLDLN